MTELARARRSDRHLQSLLTAVCGQDEDALRQLYVATSVQLTARLAPLVGAADRDDVLVGTYVALWRGAAEQRRPGPGVLSWLVELALAEHGRLRLPDAAQHTG